MRIRNGARPGPRGLASALIAIMVAAAIAGCRDKGADIMASGVFEATETIVSAEANGRLLNLTVDEGVQIAAGDVVGQVDCRQLELQKEQLATRIDGLQTRVADVGTQTGALNQQIAAAQREHARIKALVDGGSATGKQLDDIAAQVSVLRRQKAAARQSLSTANRVLDDERAAMMIQLSQIDDQIARCAIKTPVGGTVMVKYAQAGEFAAIGKALFKVADMDNMFLRAYVTADQLTRVKLGQTVRVMADFGREGSRGYQGRVAWIAAKSEFTPKTILTRDERASQVYAVKVAVKNDGYLKLGMYGHIPAGADDAGAAGGTHK